MRERNVISNNMLVLVQSLDAPAKHFIVDRDGCVLHVAKNESMRSSALHTLRLDRTERYSIM